MEQYIKKSALVAEIEKLIRKNELYLDDNVSDSVRFQKTGAYSVLNSLLHFLDTLEVKEVYLEKEIEEYLSTYWSNEKELHPFLGHMAKQFFELGLKARKEEVE